MHAKLQNDNNWTIATMDQIDWASFQGAMLSLSRSERVSICKLTNGLWNTNSQNQKYYGASDACPFCGLKETVTHVFMCTSAKCVLHRTGAFQEVQERLAKGKTP